MANKQIETEIPVIEEQSAPKITAQPDSATEQVRESFFKGVSIRELIDKISYQGIVRNTPYLMFCALLCVLYITNNNRAISLNRSINQKEKELKEIRWKYLDVQSRLMLESSETQLIERAQTIGLKPLDKPPYEIKISVPAMEQ